MADRALLPALWRVETVERETDDTVTLDLTPGPEAEPIAFAPGQFNMLYVFGVGEVPISISGDPGAASLRHTVRAVGAVSAALCALKSGASVGLRGPFGSSWPLEEADGRDVVIIAGGIGLAPLRPLLECLYAESDRFGRISLLYGARSPEQLLFEADRRRWAERFDVQVTVDRAGGDWTGAVGFVTELIDRAQFDGGSGVACLCGPEIMMRFVAGELHGHGVEDERIWLSLERNMQCAVGTCGHCLFGPEFICKDGAVFRYDRVAHLLAVKAL